jgi:hypothetical protein
MFSNSTFEQNHPPHFLIYNTMKQFTQLLICVLTLLSSFVWGQNGFTSYPIPFLTSAKYAIKVDAQANKWICSFRGLIKFDGSNFTEYKPANSNIPSNFVWDVAFDASSNVWVATSAGLAKFDGATWNTFNVINSGLPNDTINTVFVNGTDIWAGTKQGLAKFDGSNWTVYTTSNSGLINNNVTAFNMDSNGDLWIGTNACLSVKSGSTWTNYDDSNSNLPSQKIHAIHFDNSQKWVSTGTNIFEFSNNLFLPFSSRYITGLNESNNTLSTDFVTSKTLSKGPQGGLLTNNMYEFVGADAHRYNSTFTGYCHTFESSTSLVWFVGVNTLYSFNYANYTGTTLLNEPQGFNTLDINNVKAAVSTMGDMHWNGSNSAYEVPKNSGRNTIFCSNFWIGGVDGGGQLHQAAMTYRQIGFDYWPGPLDTITGTTDTATVIAYNKVWKVDRLKIEEFQTMFANGSVQNGSYTVDPTILSWPAHGTGNFSRNLAPFVDVNADGNYNPLTDGDYPKIKGDQMCFWIFNDSRTHTETGGASLGIEVHASAYAFACPDAGVNDSANALNYTTLYNYKIFNRSSNNYQQGALGIMEDVDLGGPYDDYVGCNPADNYGFVFNGDSIDDNGGTGQLLYGTNPPMQSTVILNGPVSDLGDNIDNDNDGTIDEVGERSLMTSFLYYNNDGSTTGNPGGDQGMYAYLNSMWMDSTHVTYGGDGHLSSGINTNFMFDGVPSVSGWTEQSVGNAPSDRRFVMGTNHFEMPAGESFDFDFALVYTRDTTSAANYSIQSLYQKNKQDVLRIKQWYTGNNFPSCLDVTNSITNNSEMAISFMVYPNPASSDLTIAYKPETKNAVVEIFNSIGQQVKQIALVDENQQITIADLTNGLYILKLNDGKNSATQRFVKQ